MAVLHTSRKVFNAMLTVTPLAGACCRAEALGSCQASIALYTERITEDAQPLFPINSLRNQVPSLTPVGGHVPHSPHRKCRLHIRVALCTSCCKADKALCEMSGVCKRSWVCARSQTQLSRCLIAVRDKRRVEVCSTLAMQALLMASTDLVLVSNIDMLAGQSLVESLQNHTE